MCELHACVCRYRCGRKTICFALGANFPSRSSRSELEFGGFSAGAESEIFLKAATELCRIYASFNGPILTNKHGQRSSFLSRHEFPPLLVSTPPPQISATPTLMSETEKKHFKHFFLLTLTKCEEKPA